MMTLRVKTVVSFMVLYPLLSCIPYCPVSLMSLHPLLSCIPYCPVSHMALYPMIQDVRQTLEAEILENGKIVE